MNFFCIFTAGDRGGGENNNGATQLTTDEAATPPTPSPATNPSVSPSSHPETPQQPTVGEDGEVLNGASVVSRFYFLIFI